MDRYEIAQYLVNLHILLGAQTTTGSTNSTILGVDYEKHWAMLKEEIAQDNEDK